MLGSASSFTAAGRSSPFQRKAPLETALPAFPAAIPAVEAISAACLLPTCLGYAKVEYAVSYGYGASVFSLAYMILCQLPHHSLAFWHALALAFYGARLCLFLLYREIAISRFRKFREKIEQRQAKKRRIQRTPIVAGCAVLYGCLAAPLFVTSQISSNCKILKTCVVLTWSGFVLGALADLQKSFCKSILGENTLVKGGVFTFLRHPNYTGECLGWTASYMASMVVAAQNWQRSFLGPLIGATLGWFGIISVLTMAATGLEKKQKETYGDTKEYQSWVKSSWSGPVLPRKKTV